MKLSGGKGDSQEKIGLICFCLILLKVEQIDFINILHFTVIENFNNRNFHLSHIIAYTLDFLVDSGVKRVNDVSNGLSDKIAEIKEKLSQMNLQGKLANGRIPENLVWFQMSKLFL